MGSFDSTIFANELALAMEKGLLCKTASANSEQIDTAVDDLIKAADILEELNNQKAAEIVTCVIEKLAVRK